MFLKMIPVTKWSCAGVRPETGLGEEPEPVCEGCSQVRVKLVVMMMMVVVTMMMVVMMMLMMTMMMLMMVVMVNAVKFEYQPGTW